MLLPRFVSVARAAFLPSAAAAKSNPKVNCPDLVVGNGMAKRGGGVPARTEERGAEAEERSDLAALHADWQSLEEALMAAANGGGDSAVERRQKQRRGRNAVLVCRPA